MALVIPGILFDYAAAAYVREMSGSRRYAGR